MRTCSPACSPSTWSACPPERAGGFGLRPAVPPGDDPRHQRCLVAAITHWTFHPPLRGRACPRRSSRRRSARSSATRPESGPRAALSVRNGLVDRWGGEVRDHRHIAARPVPYRYMLNGLTSARGRHSPWRVADRQTSQDHRMPSAALDDSVDRLTVGHGRQRHALLDGPRSRGDPADWHDPRTRHVARRSAAGVPHGPPRTGPTRRAA